MGWRFNDETEMELFGITFEPEKENVLTMELKRLINGMQTLCRRNENVLTMGALLKMWCGIRINVRYYHCVILTQIAHL